MADHNPCAGGPNQSVYRCAECDGQNDQYISMDNIAAGEGVCVDRACYDRNQMALALQYDARVPHTRRDLTPGQFAALMGNAAPAGGCAAAPAPAPAHRHRRPRGCRHPRQMRAVDMIAQTDVIGFSLTTSTAIVATLMVMFVWKVRWVEGDDVREEQENIKNAAGAVDVVQNAAVNQLWEAPKNIGELAIKESDVENADLNKHTYFSSQ